MFFGIYKKPESIEEGRRSGILFVLRAYYRLKKPKLQIAEMKLTIS